MWITILGLATAALGLITKLVGGGSGADPQRELGRDEQKIADNAAGLEVVRKSTEAAAMASQGGPDASDPNDRANRSR